MSNPAAPPPPAWLMDLITGALDDNITVEVQHGLHGDPLTTIAASPKGVVIVKHREHPGEPDVWVLPWRSVDAIRLLGETVIVSSQALRAPVSLDCGSVQEARQVARRLLLRFS